jgi:hypothetical protein
MMEAWKHLHHVTGNFPLKVDTRTGKGATQTISIEKCWRRLLGGDVARFNYEHHFQQ